MCAQALSNPDILRLCDPVVFGHLDVLKRAAREAKVSLPENLPVWDGNSERKSSGPAIVNCPAPDAQSIVPGKVSAACGAAGYSFIETAIRAAMEGRIDGVATAPINKEALRLAGVQFPGHTEIFTALTGSKRTCMMLRSDVLTVSMVTTHIGYAEVPQRISTQRIVDVIELTATAIATMNGRPARLAICGLNPHAGEHGLFGNREEEQFVEPAVEQARAKGISIEGPLPPDTAFTTSNRKRFDGVVCLYHDQGAHPVQDAGVRRRGEHHARPADCAHVGGSRDGVRHRMERRGEPDELLQSHRVRRAAQWDRRPACPVSETN